MGIDLKVEQENIDYFNNQKASNKVFLSRFTEQPSLEGKTILDFGCGHGHLSIDLALSGAKKVVGVDCNSSLIDFANKNLLLNYKELKDVVEFKCVDILMDVENTKYDLIISKDAFEHIIQLETILNKLKSKLNINGKILAGFGPLYNSPYGDHKRTNSIIPWGHLILPDDYIIKRLNKSRKDKISSIEDLGLNKLSMNDYLNLFKKLELSLQYININAHTNSRFPLTMKFFYLLRRIPLLEELFTCNIYCCLEKKAGDD